MATRTERCPICEQDKDLTILPCIHSFCLECLEKYCNSKGKERGDKVPCPECQTEFEIPDRGITKFPVKEYPTRQCSDGDIRKLRSRVERFRNAAAHVEEESNRMAESFAVAEQEVKKRTTVIQQLAERHEGKLIDELQSLKSVAQTQVQSKLDTVQMALAEMERSLELMSAGNPPTDITQAVSTMSLDDLLQTQLGCIPGEYHAPNCTFVPVNIDEFLGDGKNFIGHVDVKVDRSGNGLLLLKSITF